MAVALRLTDSQDLRIHPQTLLHHLETSLANFDSLLKELKCSPEDLHQTLNDPQTNVSVRRTPLGESGRWARGLLTEIG